MWSIKWHVVVQYAKNNAIRAVTCTEKKHILKIETNVQMKKEPNALIDIETVGDLRVD